MDQEIEQPNLSVREALDHAPRKETPNGIWRGIISAFIALYCITIFVWLSDDLLIGDEYLNQIPLRSVAYDYAWKIAVVFGWYQHWSLFSPNVRHSIFHETALITYEDGSTQLYEFPRMDKMDYWERHKHEKLRKMFNDNILYPWPNNGFVKFLPSIAHYLAECNSNPQNQPSMVQITWNSNENPPPDPANWNYRDKLPYHIYKTIRFVYQVRRNELIADPINHFNKSQHPKSAAAGEV